MADFVHKMLERWNAILKAKRHMQELKVQTK